MRPSIGKADRILRFDRQNRRQCRVEYTQPHRFFCGIDDMGAAPASARPCNRVRAAITGRWSEPAEPWPHCRERAHEAAGPQQLAPCPPARSQKAIEPLLLQFVHVNEAIRGSFVEGAFLDV